MSASASHVLLLLAVVLAVPSFASEQQPRTVPMKPIDLFSQAGGQATVTDKEGRKFITVKLEGLIPGGVYSAFLGRDRLPQEMKVIGPDRFKADKNGRATIKAHTDGREFPTWDAIGILYHKGGKIAGTGGKKSFIVLKGLLLARPDIDLFGK